MNIKFTPITNGKFDTDDRKSYIKLLPKLKAKRKNMIKQKILALACIGISLLSIKLLDGDGTLALFIIPCMVYLLFTKKCWLA